MHKHRKQGVPSGPAIVVAMVICAFAFPVDPPVAREETAGQQAAAPPPHPEGPHAPPKNLRRVGDHWTPYSPPDVESFPQGSKVHVIVGGDNLWNLASHYLQDPWLWPVIWDANRYITDSHWIYPGDPLLIPPMPNVVADSGSSIELLEPLPAAPGAPAAPPTPQAPARAAAPPARPALSPVADESDVYCSSYIVDRYAAPPLAIREREDGAKSLLGDGDVVFLNHGLDSSLTPGDEFTVITPEGAVPHPIFEEVVGEGVRMLGRVRVIALQETSATAVIVQSCDAIHVGMALVPFEEMAVPIAAPVEFRTYGVRMDTASSGYIVEATDGKQTLATGDIINIDLGQERGVRPGDVLTVFREWGGSVPFDSDRSYVDGQQARAEERRQRNEALENYAQSILGQAVVLRTMPHTATARIIYATREISLGDRVGRP